MEPKLPLDPPGSFRNMLLSENTVLVFVLRRSGCAGRLTSGRVERGGNGDLSVYTGSALKLNEYISGENLRSWCVLGADGAPLQGWREVDPKDREKLLSAG